MSTIFAHAPLKLAPGQTALIGPETDAPLPAQLILSGVPTPVQAGTFLGPDAEHPWLQINGALWLPGKPHARHGAVVRALSACSFTATPQTIRMWRKDFSLAWITMSDKGFRGERSDASGPLIPELVASVLTLNLVQGFLLPDSRSGLKSLLAFLALEQRFDVIVTSGGTGVAPRDISPEVTAWIVEKRLPGFEQAMMSNSLTKTPHAMISRAAAGILGTSLIINLPGSPKGARENLEALLPALKHTLDKIHNDPSDCGVEDL